jgi:predicted nucleic acid-binding Zn ribbon protein
MKRKCLECGDILTGRIDQKFCSDQCRNTYNNQLNRDENAYMRNVSRQLRKNRRILKELHNGVSHTVEKHILLSRGFSFNYFTSLSRNGQGETCYYCFEQGYRETDDGRILIFGLK